MSLENMTAHGVTNYRHLRFGASTLINEKIYPSDLKFYRRQIIREDIPRPEVVDTNTATIVIDQLLEYTKKMNTKPIRTPEQIANAKRLKKKKERKKKLTFYAEDSHSTVMSDDLNLYALVANEHHTVSKNWKTHCVDFNPGSVLEKEQVRNVRQKKQKQDSDKRMKHIQQMHIRWGRKFGFSKPRTLAFEQKFMEYDTDESGFIDLNECEKICTDLHIFDRSVLKGHRSKKREILKRIIDELDRTKSGTLNFIQFMDLMKRVSANASSSTNTNNTTLIQSIMRNRPKTAGSGSSSFHSGYTRNDERIKKIREKRAQLLKEAERKRLETYIKRSARRHYKLKQKGFNDAMKLTDDILDSNKNHFHIISPHSPHRPRRKKKASPLLQRYERLKNTQASGGFVVG